MLNFHPNNPFVREFITDEETQEFLWTQYQTMKDGDEFYRALISRGPSNHPSDFTEGVRSDSRLCDHIPLKYRRHPELFELSYNMKELAEELVSDIPDDLWFSQYEFVKYEGNGHTFMPHTDDDYDGTRYNRHLTSVTMVEATDDLEGGHLHIWPTHHRERAHNGKVPRYTIDLNPWETVIFPAWYVHEASPVTEGRRTILISWAQLGIRWDPGTPRA